MERCALWTGVTSPEASPASDTAATWWGQGRRRLRFGSRAVSGFPFGLAPGSQGSIKLRSVTGTRPTFITMKSGSIKQYEFGCPGKLLGSEFSSRRLPFCTLRSRSRTSHVSAAEQLEDLSLDGNGPVPICDHGLSSVEFDDSSSMHDEIEVGDFRRELIFLAAPAIIGQAIDPMVTLMETAYIGILGPLELASAGVSISIFNIISKLFNVPLLSITTSFVAEDISKSTSRISVSAYDASADYKCLQVNGGNGQLSGLTAEKVQLSSVSSALVLAVGIGALEGLALFCGSGWLLNMMGVSAASPMRVPAEQFLHLRALGAPANVLSLAVQGVFRGFKDTTTPLFCVGVGNMLAAILFPVLIYSLHLGVPGAALATVASQYIATFLLLWRLSRRAVLLPPENLKLDLSGYIKSGGLVLGRTLSVLSTMTLATSMATRLGPLAMAAHQICLNVWLAVSLICDALALSAQALIASSFAKGDYQRVKGIAYYVLKMGVIVGVSLAVILGGSFGSLAGIFTKDIEVHRTVLTGMLFVSATQPINALAFIFDGLHYGVSDFSYSAISMMIVGALSSLSLVYAPRIFGLPGVWFGLTFFMALRSAAGFLRLYWRTGPWSFMHNDDRALQVAN